jgi:hypothetical protein
MGVGRNVSSESVEFGSGEADLRTDGAISTNEE